MQNRLEAIGCFTMAMLFAGSLALSGAVPETPRPQAVAQLEVGSTRVDWLPKASAYERLTLTVSGPGDFYLRQEFGPDQAPVLSLINAQGERLPDGIYAYELHGTPWPNRQEGKLAKRSLVQSGYLSIREGSFVEPDSAQGASLSREESASKPARPNVKPKDTVVPDDLVVQGNACIGPTCTSVALTDPILKLKGGWVQLRFEDDDQISYARDWALQANDTLGGSDRFFVYDVDANTTPVSIEGATPSHALYVRSNGNVGLGTSTPAARLEVSSGEVRLPHGSPGGGYTHFNYVGDNRNYIRGTTIIADLGGSVGIGTSSPAANLDIAGYSSVEMRMVATTVGTWQILNDSTGYGIQLLGSGFRAVNVNSSGNMQLHGTLTQGSSRDLKTNFVSLDSREVLARVKALPVSSWSYKLDEPEVRHVGPTAEDFHQAFGLGADNKHIAPSDQAGVALVAVQGLTRIVEEKTQEIEALRRKNADLEGRLAALEAMLSVSKPQE